MGTNYYTEDGRHLGKTSNVGGKRYVFIANPDNYPTDALSETVIDEYGDAMPYWAFDRIVAGALRVETLRGDFS